MTSIHTFILCFSISICCAQADFEYPRVIDSSQHEVLFVYEHYIVIDTTYEDIYFSELMGLDEVKEKVDTALFREMNAMQLSDLIPKDTIHLYVHIQPGNDTAWRYEMKDNKVAGFFLRIPKNDNVIMRHTHFDPQSTMTKTSLESLAQETSVTHLPGETKTIRGWNCSKYRIEMGGDKNNPVDVLLGKSILELYATEDLKFPLHFVVANANLAPGLFPLEMVSWSEQSPRYKFVHRLISFKEYLPEKN